MHELNLRSFLDLVLLDLSQQALAFRYRCALESVTFLAKARLRGNKFLRHFDLGVKYSCQKSSMLTRTMHVSMELLYRACKHGALLTAVFDPKIKGDPKIAWLAVHEHGHGTAAAIPASKK